MRNTEEHSQRTQEQRVEYQVQMPGCFSSIFRQFRWSLCTFLHTKWMFSEWSRLLWPFHQTKNTSCLELSISSTPSTNYVLDQLLPTVGKSQHSRGKLVQKSNSISRKKLNITKATAWRSTEVTRWLKKEQKVQTVKGKAALLLNVWRLKATGSQPLKEYVRWMGTGTRRDRLNTTRADIHLDLQKQSQHSALRTLKNSIFGTEHNTYFTSQKSNKHVLGC